MKVNSFDGTCSQNNEERSFLGDPSVLPHNFKSTFFSLNSMFENRNQRFRGLCGMEYKKNTREFT